MKLKPEVKDEYVKALRDGEYIQNEGNLRTENRYCVLGVLCDLYSKHNGGEWEKSISGTHYTFLNSLLYLPHDVLAWACDLNQDILLLDENSNPLAFENYYAIFVPEYGESIGRMNDKGYNFDELADIVETLL